MVRNNFTVPISMNSKLIEMIDAHDEDGNRSRFICDALRYTFIKAELAPFETLLRNYPAECPWDVYLEILFEYVHYKHFAYTDSYEDAFDFEWVGSKEGSVKAFWFHKCVKEAIEAIEADVEEAKISTAI